MRNYLFTVSMTVNGLCILMKQKCSRHQKTRTPETRSSYLHQLRRLLTKRISLASPGLLNIHELFTNYQANSKASNREVSNMQFSTVLMSLSESIYILYYPSHSKFKMTTVSRSDNHDCLLFITRRSHTR